MAEVKVVIGANFGDEGKGLMTDYFSSLDNKKRFLNVRFNGTCQAGHTVVKDEKRHVFSHFGSGSFNPNVTTYLSSYFYINPILFNEEYDKLVKLGISPKVKVSKRCPIILIYDMWYNRVIEESRGENRHGSCGLGLWEALLRGRRNKAIYADALYLGRNKLKKVIESIRDDYYAEKFEQDGLKLSYDMEVEGFKWFSDDVVSALIDECKKMLDRIELVDEWTVFTDYDYDYFVFEGAQGLLLDWMNRDYMPNLTASRTGLHNVSDLIKYIKNPKIEVCYVTRSYFTRHGAGRFETEVSDRKELGNVMEDKTNVRNPWQGYFRYGYFDKELFKRIVTNDLHELYSYSFKKSIAVTHLNETNYGLSCKEGNMPLKDFIQYMGDGWQFYMSDTENSERVTLVK